MGTVYIGKSAENLSVADKFEPYVGVVVTAGEYTDSDGNIQVAVFEAGETSGTAGRVLEVNCPWGTQQIANDLLTKVSGFKYQPYEATNALIEPTAELGDAVNINNEGGGISNMECEFSSGMAVDVKAPFDEEIDHEFTYASTESKTAAKATRQLQEVRSSILATIDGLSAEVVKQEGGSTSSFSWHLKSDKFELKSGSTVVFKCDSTGITISGNAKVTGDITCNTLTVGTAYFTGAEAGRLLSLLDSSNAGWTAAYGSTSYGGYCHTGARYGNNYNSAATYNSQSYPSYFYASHLVATNVSTGLYIGAYTSSQFKAFRAVDGNVYTCLCFV